MGTNSSKISRKVKEKNNKGDGPRRSVQFAATKAEPPLKRSKKQMASLRRKGVVNECNVQSYHEGAMTKNSRLQQLHANPPPGFRKFESEVPWRTIDEELALQLWEGVFQPMYTTMLPLKRSPIQNEQKS